MKKQTKEQKRKEMQQAIDAQRRSSVNQQLLTAFFQRPEWMAKFDNNDRRLAVKFIRQALYKFDEQFSELNKNFKHALEHNDMDTVFSINELLTVRMKESLAVEHLLHLLDDLMYESVSLEEFMQGKRPEDNRPFLPDFSHISRLN